MTEMTEVYPLAVRTEQDVSEGFVSKIFTFVAERIASFGQNSIPRRRSIHGWVDKWRIREPTYET